MLFHILKNSPFNLYIFLFIFIYIINLSEFTISFFILKFCPYWLFHRLFLIWYSLLLPFFSKILGLVENPNFGRRTLLLYGNTGVTVSLAALSLLYSFPFLPPEITQTLIISFILFFVGSYHIGFGPISWLILSEIFPLRIRSTAISIGTLFNFGSNLLVATLFEIERVSLGEGVLFGQFAIIALFATLFTWKYVFETRGLSLEEVEIKLKEIVDGKIE